MVGVCLTVIGLIRVVITLGTADTLADDLLAADALLFLISCLLSYWALRSRGLRRMHRLEKIADGIFISRHDRDGCGLCVDYLYDFCSCPVSPRRKNAINAPCYRTLKPLPSAAALDAAPASDVTLVLE